MYQVLLQLIESKKWDTTFRSSALPEKSASMRGLRTPLRTCCPAKMGQQNTRHPPIKVLPWRRHGRLEVTSPVFGQPWSRRTSTFESFRTFTSWNQRLQVFFLVSPSTHLVSVSQKVSAFCFLLFNSFLVLDSCLPSHMISRSQSPSATQAILPPEVFSFSHAMRCVIASRKVGASSTSAWVFCCGKIKTSLPRQGGLAPTSYQACAQNVELMYTYVNMYMYTVYVLYKLVYRQSINLYKYTSRVLHVGAHTYFCIPCDETFHTTLQSVGVLPSKITQLLAWLIPVNLARSNTQPTVVVTNMRLTMKTGISL